MVVGSHPHPEEVASGAAEGRDVPAPSVMSFMSFIRGMEGDTNQRLDGRLLASPNPYMSLLQEAWCLVWVGGPFGLVREQLFSDRVDKLLPALLPPFSTLSDSHEDNGSAGREAETVSDFLCSPCAAE